MIATRQTTLFVPAVVIVGIAGMYSCQMHAQSAAQSRTAGSPSGSQQWSVQVDRVDRGDVNLEPSFQIAIYESLLDELSKTKQFKQVMRDGDRNANDASNLLILKTTVQKYTAGSETRRAVTTVSGATKLTVRSRLCTRDGKIVSERTVDGNVRFMGNNLKATRNLAHNVVKTITALPLPAASQPIPVQSGRDLHPRATPATYKDVDGN